MERVCPDCLARVEPRELDMCPQCGFARASAPNGEWLADPLRGLILNQRYRLEARLGAGGMATVFRAARLGALGGHVAVKILAPRYARTVVAKRFEREAMVISRLTSPQSVRIYDFEAFQIEGIAQPVFYIAMELVQGRTLDEVLGTEGRVNFFWGIDVLRQIARALDEAHQLGIVHRDLKPSNIMVVQQHGSTHVKVLDFGIAGLKAPEGKPVEQLTHLGVVSGTPEYMSPEQAAGEGNVAASSDIYALGLIAFEMFAGRRPFQGETSIETLVIRLSEPPPRMEEAIDDPSFPPALCTVVNKMLQKRAAERYEDAHAVLEALAAFPTLQTSPGFVPPAELLKRYATTTAMTAQGDSPLDLQGAEGAARKKPRTALWIGVGVALAGGVAAAVIATLPSGTEAPPVAGPGPGSGTPPTVVAGPETPWAPPALAPVGAFAARPTGLLCAIDGPAAPVPLYVPLYLSLACTDAAGEAVPVSDLKATLTLSRSRESIGPVEFKVSGAKEAVGLRLPPRPLADRYAVEISGVVGSQPTFALALQLDARTGTLSPAVVATP